MTVCFPHFIVLAPNFSSLDLVTHVWFIIDTMPSDLGYLFYTDTRDSNLLKKMRRHCSIVKNAFHI